MNSGALTKAEIGTINALRFSGGQSNGDIAKNKLTAAVRKQPPPATLAQLPALN
jgi:hypothetical protein